METLLAPAKLTTSLHVTGVRPDGMHLIEAEMVSLDLADTLEIGPGDGLAIVGHGTDTVGFDVDTGPDNLIRRALALVGRTAQVRVHKQIPAGAGLGGGSADAAAILRWAGMTDEVAAANLGADVAFCLVGGSAQVSGIGERIRPTTYERRTFTLLTPAFGCSTPVVYRSWDELGGPTGTGGNDLEPAALAAYPGLAESRDRLGSAAGVTPRLAGSGSTWFVEGAVEVEGGIVAVTVPAGWAGGV